MQREGKGRMVCRDKGKGVRCRESVVCVGGCEMQGECSVCGWV